MIDLGPGTNYLVAAIVVGVILLAFNLAGVSLGVLQTILTVVAILLVAAWALYLFGVIR